MKEHCCFETTLLPDGSVYRGVWAHPTRDGAMAYWITVLDPFGYSPDRRCSPHQTGASLGRQGETIRIVPFCETSDDLCR